MVFSSVSNTMFGNTAFMVGTIPAMENSWDRLVEAAGLPPEADERKVVSLLVAELGKLVGSTPQQTISNWRTRGVSIAGALAAQQAYRCDANWVLTGQGARILTWPFSPELLSAVSSLNHDGLSKLEGVMRAHLGMVPKPTQSLPDLLIQPVSAEANTGTTVEPALKVRPNLERVTLKEQRAAGRKTGKVQKQGAGRGPKGTARRG